MTNQEAIEILREKIFPCVIGDWKEAVGVAISALQAQEAKTQLSAKDICVPCKDLVSRTAAIEHLKKRLYETALNNCTERPYYEEIADNRVDTWLNELPSAQPEIIYCKDCKHYKAFEYTGRLACHYVIGGTVIRNPNDFCSRAERI